MLKKQSDFSRFCLRVSLVPRPASRRLQCGSMASDGKLVRVWVLWQATGSWRGPGLYCKRWEAGEGLGSMASDGKLARVWVLWQATGSWRGPGFYGKWQEAGWGPGNEATYKDIGVINCWVTWGIRLLEFEGAKKSFTPSLSMAIGQALSHVVLLAQVGHRLQVIYKLLHSSCSRYH